MLLKIFDYLIEYLMHKNLNLTQKKKKKKKVGEKNVECVCTMDFNKPKTIDLCV